METLFDEQVATKNPLEYLDQSPKCRLLILFHLQDTAVQLVYDPLSRFISLAKLYSQLQLSLWSDPIALGIPIST